MGLLQEHVPKWLHLLFGVAGLTNPEARDVEEALTTALAHVLDELEDVIRD